MKSKPDVSIIVANFNGEKYLKSTITSLLKLNLSLCEIIIVDDASTDNSQKLLRSYKKNKHINVLFFDHNKGPATTRNTGARGAQGSILLFVDMDCKIDKQSIEAIHSEFSTYKKTGGIIYKLTNTKSKKLDYSGAFLSHVGLPYETGSGENPSFFKIRLHTFGVKTAAYAIRKKVFDEIGGFDEDYKIHGEDFDLAWRVWLAGYENIFLPSATGVHHQKGSYSSKTSDLIFYEGTKNNLSNLIKNLPFRDLCYLVPSFLIFHLLLMTVLIVRGNMHASRLIGLGIFWNLSHIIRTLKKRKKVLEYSVHYTPELYKIMFGPLQPKDIITKGLKWIKSI